MKTLKNSPLVSLLSVAAVLCLTGAGYHWFSLRDAERNRVASSYRPLAEAKRKMLFAYETRLRVLEKWGVKATGPARIEIPKLETQADADRFDRAQNEVSEKINRYLSAGAPKDFLKQIQKAEEAINHDRRNYHRIAFQILDANRRYHLGTPPPPVFAAERMMKERNLF